MSISETITRNDLTNILNEVLLSPNYGGIYKASWTASSSSANGTQLTADLIIPAGTYVINCISPVASVDFSLAIAGRYKEMNKSGDSFTIIYSCDEEVTFHVSSAQSAAVTFSYTDRGSLTAIQISQQSVASNVTDYIVEEGTDGIWTYRKWNSGLIEADIVIASPTWGTANTINGIIRQQMTLPTPPTMITKLGIYSSGVNSGSWTASGFDGSMTPLVYCYRISGQVTPTNVTVHLRGTWK